MKLRPLLLFSMACAIPTFAHAADLHVAPHGDDLNSGDATRPFATLAAARDAARAFVGREPVTVHVADGIYYLPETLVLGPEDSGLDGAPVLYRAVNEGRAVLSGGLRLSLKWEPCRDGIYRASTPPGLALDQLFLNGLRQHMARYPDYDAGRTTAAYQGFAPDAFSPERAARWADPTGGYIHAMHAQRWGGYHYRITGKKPDGAVAYEGGWQNNRQMGMHKEFRMVENIFEELDAPGEWFHDAKANLLYLQPPAGIDLDSAVVEVVRLRHLVEVRGNPANPARFITLQGFVFRHAARTFMDTREPLLRSDWTIYRGGAVLLSGVRDIQVLDSEFDQVGGNAVFVDRHARRVLVRGCHIHDPGASGVVFVGDPGAVRNPLFEYGRTQDLSKIDRTPGPKTDDYPADSAVEDCLIHGVGRVERQAAGVQISMSARIAIRDVSIYDCSRAGINISEGTWGGHLLERLDVFDTVLETHDHGSFNSWGRDRFWTPKHREVSEPAIKADPRLPFLDAAETTVIRDSRWRCDHGWDVDLDDGSSNYDIYNNLMLAGGLKLREGYRRHAWNNIHVNNGLHPHVWFDGSDDRFYSNIVMRAHAPVRQPEGWGVGVNRNLFVSAADLARHRASGADADSIAGDPLFVDPASGDYRVRDGSPAFAIGFKNFPMDQFGVKKPALKSIARTPPLPKVTIAPAATAPAPREEAAALWLGATLRDLRGEEFSAFGVSKESGGAHLAELPADSAAALAGLRRNDLIQGVNDRPITSVAEFRSVLRQIGAVPLSLRIIRDQQPVTVTVQTPAP